MICGHNADIGVKKVPCGQDADIQNHLFYFTFYHLQKGKKIAETLDFIGFPLS